MHNSVSTLIPFTNRKFQSLIELMILRLFCNAKCVCEDTFVRVSMEVIIKWDRKKRFPSSTFYRHSYSLIQSNESKWALAELDTNFPIYWKNSHGNCKYFSESLESFTFFFWYDFCVCVFKIDYITLYSCWFNSFSQEVSSRS